MEFRVPRVHLLQVQQHLIIFVIIKSDMIKLNVIILNDIIIKMDTLQSINNLNVITRVQ